MGTGKGCIVKPLRHKLLISFGVSLAVASVLYGSQDLEAIVVTAKTKSLEVDTAGSFTVISSKDIKRMAATTIQEVLEEQVGISVGVNSSSIGGRKSISIRGTDSKHSLILIDGKKVSGSDAQIGHSDFQYSWLPLNAIEKIEIIRGPMSSLYGSSAIGGVVNIITKKPTETLSGEMSARFGKSNDDGGDEIDGTLLLGGKITDKLSATAFIQAKNLSVTKNDIDPGLTALIEGKQIINGMANLWYDIDDSQQLSISAIVGKEIRDYIIRMPGVTAVFDKYYDIDKLHYSFGYYKSFEDLTLDLKYYTTKSDAHSDEYKKTHTLDSDVMSAELTYSGFSDHYIIAGIEKKTDGYTQDHDNPAKTDFTAEIDYTSAYAQDEILVGEDLILTLGLRYDKHEKFGNEFSPKAGLVYKMGENHRLKAAYGHGFNAPTVTQNSSSYGFFGPYNFLGNDKLKPERSNSYEIGYEYRSDDVEFKAIAYKTKIDDLILFTPLSNAELVPYIDAGLITREAALGTTTYLYSNIAESTMRGLEIELEKKDILSNIDLKVGYHYLKTEDQDGKELLFKPKHKLSLRVNAALPYDIEGTLRIKYTGEQLTKINDIRKKLNGYTTMGIQLSKKFSHFTAKVGIENITDEKLGGDYPFNNKGRMVYGEVSYKF